MIAIVTDPPHRTWADVRRLLDARRPRPGGAAATPLAVFTRLAAAEAAVHGVDADDVHFHEVGALDAIGDVVGVCAALRDLGADDGHRLAARPRARARCSSGHGTLPGPGAGRARAGRGLAGERRRER